MSQVKDKLIQNNTEALKSGDKPLRKILSFLLGEIQLGETRQNKQLTDDEVYKVLNKVGQGIKDSIKYAKDRTHLDYELSVVESYLPQYMSLSDMLGEILNSDGPEFEQVQNSSQAKDAFKVLNQFFSNLKSDEAIDKSLFNQLIAKIKSNPGE